MKIIFVDDSPQYLNSMKSLCEVFKLQAEVVMFEDGFAAMAFIAKNHHDILGVFTDYRMTDYGVSGEVIGQKCQELKVPVYICTGMQSNNLQLKSKLPVICKLEIHKLMDALRVVTYIDAA